jgi:hypothetical protein
MGRSIFSFFILFCVFFLFSCAGKESAEKPESFSRLTVDLPGEKASLTLEYPAGWKIDTAQDYCDLIAYGPEDVYSMVTAEPSGSDGLEAFIRKFFQAFSFHENFSIHEEIAVDDPVAGSKIIIYSYRETARNKQFTEYTLFCPAEQGVVVIQYTAPGNLFEKYRSRFQQLSKTVAINPPAREVYGL